jgi:hypothetical protein
MRTRTRFRTAMLAVAAAAALVGWAIAPGSRPADAATATRYVFTAFTNSSESNMYVYTSTDAKNFTLLKGPAYTPPSGLIRDPSVLRAADGKYYVVYTTNWTGTTIGIASSTDLVNWAFVRNVPITVSGVQETWAPEWFVDPSNGSINVIVSLSTQPLSADAGFRPYLLTAQNSSFSSWSAPVALSGGFAGTNHIDTFVVRSGSTYHAFTKNESTKYIEHATATSLAGPYTFVGTGNWSGWGSTLEGPALTQLDDGTWRIYMDGYSQKRYYYADSRDLTTWSAKTELPGGLSGFVRHGTVLHETVTTSGSGTFTSTAVAQHSSKCLDVPNGTMTTGTQLQQWTCNGAGAQSFQFRPSGTAGNYAIVNTGNNLCLDIASASTADGAAVIQWTCNGAADQTFTLRASGAAYQLVAAHSGRCVDVSGVSTADGAKVVQWTCGTGANQLWRLPTKP